MEVEDGARRGRPRRHSSSAARATAYLRRAAGQGLVRVSVLVPAGRAADIRAIAGAMRQASRAQRATASVPKADPNARRSWSSTEDEIVVKNWRAGATGHELTSGLGRPLDEILRRLVELEEAGSVRDARAEVAARARADRSSKFMKS